MGNISALSSRQKAAKETSGAIAGRGNFWAALLETIKYKSPLMFS